MTGTRLQIVLMWNMTIAVWCQLKTWLGLKTRTYAYEVELEPIENQELELPPVWW